MTINTLPSLLGIFALAFLVLMLVKVSIQQAEDGVAKALLVLMFTGMLSMAFCLFYIYASMGQQWPRFASVEIGLTYWIGPSLYFYIKRLNGGASPFADWRTLLHWLPGILIEIILLPFFLRPLPGTTDALGNDLFTVRWLIWYVWLGFHLQLTIYVLRCQPLMQLHRQRLVDNYSDLSLINLRWLQFCCIGFLGMILAERLPPALGLTSTNLSNTAGIILYLFIIVLMYIALGQSRLSFANVGSAAPAVDRPAADAPGNEKYQRSGLRDDSAQYYVDKLARLMASERYYLEGDLSLQALAARVNLSPHHLSQILNDKLGKNFYDYINEQRVEFARQELLKQPPLPITDIAFAAGYNSKNSFYNAFKRHCGMTPTEFRSRHQQ